MTTNNIESALASEVPVGGPKMQQQSGALHLPLGSLKNRPVAGPSRCLRY
jgi:hypothetical protein